MQLRYELALVPTCSGATDAYPEVPPYAVGVQFKPTLPWMPVDLASRLAYHTRRHVLDKQQRVSGSIQVSLASLPSQVGVTSHVALTFYATGRSFDVQSDERTYVEALGDISLPLSTLAPGQRTVVQEDMRFEDKPAQQRTRLRLISKATLKAGSWFELIYTGSALQPSLPSVAASEEHQIQMRKYGDEYRDTVHRRYGQVVSAVRMMHFPEYLTRAGLSLPSWTLLMKRPAGTPSAAFYENLIKHACVVLRTQPAFECAGSDISVQSIYEDVLSLLDVAQPGQLVPPLSALDGLERNCRVGSLLVVACALYAQHNTYVADHVNLVGVRGAPQAGDHYTIIERVRDCQETPANDCEDKAQHPCMLLSVLRETNWDALEDASPLIKFLSLYLKLNYAPALVQTTATTASASFTSEAKEEAESLLHTFGMLMPRSTVERLAPTGAHFALQPTERQRARMASAPPLIIEGTTLMLPLLAPLHAFGVDLTADELQALEQKAIDQERMSLAYKRMRQECSAVTVFDFYTGPSQLTVAPRRVARRENYELSRADARHTKMSNFYLRPTHIQIGQERLHSKDPRTLVPTWPVDYLVTDQSRKKYGVPAEQVFLDTDAYTLTPVLTPFVATSLLARSVLEAACAEPAMAALRAPQPLALRNRCVDSSEQMPAAWSALEFVSSGAKQQQTLAYYLAIRSMESELPSRRVREVADYCRRQQISLRLHRMRLVSDEQPKEWVQFVLSLSVAG